MNTLPRLTPHQREVFERVARHAKTNTGARSDNIGSKGALAHLVHKGYLVETVAFVGPRGGVTYRYSLTPAALATRGGVMAKRGSKRPYGIRYEWENGVKGAVTFHSISERQDFIDKMYQRSADTDMEVRIETYERPVV